MTRGKLDRMRKLAVPAAVAFHISATTLMYFAGKFESLSRPFPDAATYQGLVELCNSKLRLNPESPITHTLLKFYAALLSSS